MLTRKEGWAVYRHVGREEQLLDVPVRIVATAKADGEIANGIAARAEAVPPDRAVLAAIHGEQATRQAQLDIRMRPRKMAQPGHQPARSE